MKKGNCLSMVVILVGIVLLLFGAFPIKMCPTDAPDFWSHTSKHWAEMGGPEGMSSILQGIADGSIAFNAWSDGYGAVIVSISSSPYGPLVFMFGDTSLPTMYPSSMDYINNKVRGLSKVKSSSDLAKIASTASCFAAAAPVTVAVATQVPVSSPAPIAGMITIVIGALIFVLGKLSGIGGRGSDYEGACA